MSGLFGSTTIKGNRITDFANTTATVGVVIPFGYGRFPSDGNVIFAPLPPEENRSVQRQGKGGVKQETYTYTMSYAVAFCRGPILGYLWIKRNGKIVYTSDPSAPVEDQAYAAKWLQKATLYYGTRTQLPDSTIESYVGVGQVSAFRGLAYIVIEDDDVTENGGAVPTYEACIIANGIGYLTTPLYPVEFMDVLNTEVRKGGGELRDIYWATDYEEAFEPGVQLIEGEIRSVFQTYESEPDVFEQSIELQTGTLKNALRNYTSEPDVFTGSPSLLTGLLKDALISYVGEPEEFSTEISLLSGFTTGSSSGPDAPHQYWRVRFTAAQSGGYISLAELEFRASIGGADQCVGGTASADTFYGSGYEASKAFDNDNGTEWASGASLPHWLAYTFAAPVVVQEIAITATDAAYGPSNEGPRDFEVQYSDDGVTWSTAATITGQTGWTYSQQRTFPV